MYTEKGHISDCCRGNTGVEELYSSAGIPQWRRISGSLRDRARSRAMSDTKTDLTAPCRKCVDSWTGSEK